MKIQCQIDDWLNKRKIKEQEKALVQSSENAQLYHQLLDKEGYESGKIIIIGANQGKPSEQLKNKNLSNYKILEVDK